MESFKGPCRHLSVPVEVDERLLPSTLSLPPCQQCGDGPPGTNQPTEDCVSGTPQGPALGPRGVPEESRYQRDPASLAAPRPGVVPPEAWLRARWAWVQQYEQELMELHGGPGSPGPSVGSQNPSTGAGESLERPFPLRSHQSHAHYLPSPYPATPLPGAGPMQGGGAPRCTCCPPANQPHPSNHYSHYKRQYPAGRHQQEPQQHQKPVPPQQRKGALGVWCGSLPQRPPPSRDLVQQVSVSRSLPPGRGLVRGEVKRTISLPEECRNVFITYSADTAKDMIPFIGFLVAHRFKPSIDIFDSPVRTMGITKWMDSFLNDQSVLIIVVISPRYKEDVEGDGDDEHGLHTKYIHNQIQNEYIQLGCRNFRLVPVLFPNATKNHVPNWLRSTRIYRWPQDDQDLLLRLFREERYILPQQGADLTLTIRPL